MEWSQQRRSMLTFFIISFLLVISVLVFSRADSFMEGLGYVRLEDMTRIQQDNLDEAKQPLEPKPMPKPSPPSPSAKLVPRPSPPPPVPSPSSSALGSDSSSSPEKLFKFYDNQDRPSIPFSSYPNRDIPPTEFPPSSWQNDVVYINHFVQEGIDLKSIKWSSH